jgi:predicted transcriptional regulator
LKDQGTRKVILLSVLPRFADKIVSGAKTVELRKIRPKVGQGDLILLYATSPEKSIRAILRISNLRSGDPDSLWKLANGSTGIDYSEFKAYFNGNKVGWAICFDTVVVLPEPVTLPMLRINIPGFHPPRIHQYFSIHELRRVVGSALNWDTIERTLL